MKTQQKIEKKGYTVVYTTQGNVIATKGQRSYKAKNISQLFKILFTPTN